MSQPRPSPVAQSSESSKSEFSQEERRLLLRLAHDSILSALEGREIPLDPPTTHLAQPRGVFTTLHLGGELRGCVGYVLPVASLYRAVAETARAAAFDDTRFYPVTLEEAPHLEIELSILSVPQPIGSDDVEIGRHGLLISMGGRRGLLLPQVPVEHNWDRVTFLEQTCRKAGLPLDAWQKGAVIEAFSAEVFGEERAQE
ncbi:MAG TPA: AmmeMemoRadiSam system protein A [Candidatus Acidoferrales bacterium]|nr:AmmeMemoRadiSam system protein A [Candidatus Acidoferrales bacterium]